MAGMQVRRTAIVAELLREERAVRPRWSRSSLPDLLVTRS
jgi:hypothetical protein